MLAAPLADLIQLGVAVVAFDRHFERITHAAVNFHSHARNPGRRLAGEVFGQGDLPGEGAVHVVEPGALADQQPGRFGQRGHFGDDALDHLILRDAPAELDPLVGVFDRGLEAGLAQADRAARDADAAPVQGGHGHHETPAPLAQQVLLGRPDVLEGDLGDGGGLVAQLGRLARRPARLVGFDHDGAEPLVPEGPGRRCSRPPRFQPPCRSISRSWRR